MSYISSRVHDKLTNHALAVEAQHPEASTCPALYPTATHTDLAHHFAWALNSVLQPRTERLNGEIDLGPTLDKTADTILDLVPGIDSEDLLLRITQGTLYIYSDGYWCAEERIEGWIQGLLGMRVWRKGDTRDKKTQEVTTPWTYHTEQATFRPSAGDVQGIAKMFMAIEKIQDPVFFVKEDVDGGGVCVNNGYLKIEHTGKPEAKGWEAYLEPHSPKHRASFKLPMDFDAAAGPPAAFLGHLESCYKGDDDKDQKIAVIQEWVGMAITGMSTRISDASCLLFEGVAKSGKSINHKVIEAIFPRVDGGGNQIIASQRPDEWDGNGNSSDFKICNFQHVRLNSVAELPDWKRLERSDTFKKMITGDPMSARKPGEKGFTFTPQAAHVMSNNNVGQTAPEDSEAFLRRFKIVKHNNSFTNGTAKESISYLKELTSPESMLSMLPWGTAGAMRLLRNGGNYTKLESHEEALEDWRAQSSPLNFFLEQCCLVESDFSQTFHYVFKTYREWCDKSQLYGTEVLKRNAFRMELTAQGARVYQDHAKNQLMVSGADIRDGSTGKATHGNWVDDFGFKGGR